METHQISENRITDIACSPDGRFAAATDDDGVYLLDAKSMEIIRTVKTKEPAECVAFSPDSQSVCVGMHGGNVLIIQTKNAEERLIKTKATGFSAAAWSPDGKLICLGQYEPALTLIVTDTWKSIVLDPDIYDDSGRTKVLFSENSEDIMSTAGNQICIWQKPRGSRYVSDVLLTADHGGRFTDMLLGPDRALFAIEESEQESYLHKLASRPGEKPTTVKLPDYFSRLAWTEKHKCIAVAEFPGKKLIYRKPGDLSEEFHEPADVGEYPIACITECPESGFLLIGTRNGSVLH
ncbi:WD40 repeat domain-containing protein [Dyadobacter sp. MSC1_007]|jgi:WD40 repeat protein|uniref:WD40 repeat domain-containing protein n=1 Tax=Dyadobacter sp. MSC1_007 TaxID=2909264 RepID=UPI00202E2F3D|nr:WD40 repeat domain-containing protein [Dyadobacter sp. MSC1_007]